MAEILACKHVTKMYPGVLALNDVSISFEEGEIHALMGENGAGKSTLIKSIAGAHTINEGSIVIHGVEHKKLTPIEAIECGVAVIYQEFNLVDSLSVAENIFLGKKLGSSICPDFKEMERQAVEIFERFGIKMDPTRMVNTLSTGQKQIVEIAKAISRNAKFIVMDEPTATLSVKEVRYLFELIHKLKEQGVTILYISHRIDEVFEISDRISIMRDGCYITTLKTSETNRKELVQYMVGRSLDESYPERNHVSEEVVFEAVGLTGNGASDVSFKLHQGEILGFGGLVGAGRSEIARVICGVERKERGQTILKGQNVELRSVSHAISLGIGLIPEDRKTEGCFLTYPIDWNISLMSLRRLSKRGVMNNKLIDETCGTYFKKLNIVAPSAQQLVRNLSGGNQQKVVLAKTLAAQSKIIIFDEPTRGIDVGAKQEIYHLMDQLTKEGCSIIMISSDMEELLGMSDRILVMHEGRVSGEILKQDFSQERVLELASGLH